MKAFEWDKVKLRRIRKDQLNTKQRRNLKREQNRTKDEDMEAFFYYTDPRNVKVTRKIN